jgi:hypothetical protein
MKCLLCLIGLAGLFAMTDGEIDGDNLSFSVKLNGQNGEFIINYKGKVSGSETKLTSTFPGREETFELTARKVS